MNKKKRLLVIHPALAPYRVDFFNSLNESFESTFYFFNDNLLNQKFNQNNLKQNIDFDCNYLKRGFNFFGRSFRYGTIAIIKEKKPDIVFLPEYHVLNIIVILFRFFSIKKFKTYLICDDNIVMASDAGILKRMLRYFQLKHINGIILTHHDIVEWYKEQLTPNCKLLIFPIIREEKKFIKQLNTSVSIAQDYIAKYQLKHKMCLLFVGRLVEVKNLTRLIEAFKIVHDKNKDATLIIVGSGTLENSLKSSVSKLNLNDSVIIPGRFEGKQLLAWYLTARIFILPSIYEPFGAVINEALIAGNYVLASNLAGGSSLLKENINGNTFNPYEVNEMANLILDTISNTKLFEKQGEIKDSTMLIDYKKTFEIFKSELTAI